MHKISWICSWYESCCERSHLWFIPCIKSPVFQDLLAEINSQSKDLLFFLSSPLVKRVFNLREEIATFFEWFLKLAFLTDKTSHMNDLNTKLQHSNQLTNKLYQYINIFKRKLKLLEKQITDKNFVHFLRLNTNQPTDNSIYIYRTWDTNLK